MKQLKHVVPAIIFATIFGCSEKPKQELQISVAADLNPEAKTIVTEAWPKIKQACPGLNKYASSLQFDGIEENFSYAPEHAQRVSIKFKIPDNDQNIPLNYVANGHTCYLEVSRDGKTLTVSKNACKAVCLDKEIHGTSYENNQLMLSLQ